ncbi:MAG: hypothetical protein RLZZ385_1437 [Pseudomonadota bacterium]
MIINNFHILRPGDSPAETDPKLFVDSDAMLAFAIMG